MVDGRDGVLPDEVFRGDFRTQVARPGTHVAVCHLEPCPGEGVGQLVRVRMESPGDWLIDGIHPHGHVRRGHDRRMPLRRIVSIRYEIRPGAILGHPLKRSGRTLHTLPLVAEQDVKVTGVPLHRVGGPCAFDAARDRGGAIARAEAALPAQPLLGDVGGLGFRTHQRLIARAMALAEGVSASDQRDGLLVVHGHPGEGLANVSARSDRVRIAVGSLRIHVDQTHLDGTERNFEIPITGVALVAKPFVL